MTIVTPRRVTRFAAESQPSPQGRTISSAKAPSTLVESRLFAYEDGSLPSDALLSRLLQMSLQSLRGYLEVVDLGRTDELTIFTDVIVRQRSAQCRQLAGFLDRFEYSSVCTDRETMALRTAWIRALAALDQGNEAVFARHVAVAEQVLQDYCLAAAIEISCDFAHDILREYAINLSGALDRLDKLSGS
jgi:hypothetical protein